MRLFQDHPGTGFSLVLPCLRDKKPESTLGGGLYFRGSPLPPVYAENRDPWFLTLSWSSSFGHLNGPYPAPYYRMLFWRAGDGEIILLAFLSGSSTGTGEDRSLPMPGRSFAGEGPRVPEPVLWGMFPLERGSGGLWLSTIDQLRLTPAHGAYVNTELYGLGGQGLFRYFDFFALTRVTVPCWRLWITRKAGAGTRGKNPCTLPPP